MHEHLWLGVDGRIEESHHFYREMGRSLRVPDCDGSWQDSFYTNVNTFLAKTRSVPPIIEACFGKDLGSRQMKDWWATLTPDEQQRRDTFSRQFRADREAFRQHDLTAERDGSEHRRGFANIEGRVVGPFGTVYVARPGVRIPSAEPRPLEPNINDDPALMWAATLPPRPIEPRWDQFTIGGKPLFEECRVYLQTARDLRRRAQTICDAVHGAQHMTGPPT